MATVKFKGTPMETVGELPKVGEQVPAWVLTRADLTDMALADLGKKHKLLNIFPSLDTGVCAASVREFNRRAGQVSTAIVLHISRDLPFAQKRFCQAEAINNSETVSAFRSSFPRDYGLEIATGPMKGLCARSVLVLDGENQVVYAQLVEEITHEPDYQSAMHYL